MAFSKGSSSICLSDIRDMVSEIDILSYYLNITKIPCIINSPLRVDNNPSFGLYSHDGKRIFYTDFSTKEKGGVFDLLSKMWGISYQATLSRVYEDMSKFTKNTNINTTSNKPKPIIKVNTDSELLCKTREWRDYDIEYWESYGISLEWLKYADVYPISHKIIVKEGHKYVFGADKYAYAYVEHKEGKVTLKIYQPLVKDKRRKWSNKHDMSVISLWTKVPEYGDRICICSSLKDALCLWANTGIPALAVQGEGYNMSDTAINELKRRYNKVFILFDNDEAGLKDGEKLAESTGFINIVLPRITELGNPKDISDLYKSLENKEEFRKLILNLFI